MKKIIQFAILAIVLIFGAGGFFYFHIGDFLKDPVEQMHAMLDDNINQVLSPLSASGNTDTMPGIAELKIKIITLHNAAPPLNETVYRQALQICELLTIAATERNVYIKSLEQNREVTRPLLIASGKRPASYGSVNVSSSGAGSLDSQQPSQQSTPRRQVQKVDNASAQKSDAEARIQHNEHAVIQQWNEKMVPYRNMISARYPNFALIVKQ